MELYTSSTAFSKMQMTLASTSAQATHLGGAAAPMDMEQSTMEKLSAVQPKARTTARARASRRPSTTMATARERATKKEPAKARESNNRKDGTSKQPDKKEKAMDNR